MIFYSISGVVIAILSGNAWLTGLCTGFLITLSATALIVGFNKAFRKKE